MDTGEELMRRETETETQQETETTFIFTTRTTYKKDCLLKEAFRNLFRDVNGPHLKVPHLHVETLITASSQSAWAAIHAGTTAPGAATWAAVTWTTVDCWYWVCSENTSPDSKNLTSPFYICWNTSIAKDQPKFPMKDQPKFPRKRSTQISTKDQLNFLQNDQPKILTNDQPNFPTKDWLNIRYNKRQLTCGIHC